MCAWSLLFQAFCSRWEQFYFLESFNPAPRQIKSGDTTNQARNAAIKMQTCRQFVDFSDPRAKSLFVLSKTKCFVSKLRTKEKKEFVPFLLSFRQTGCRVHSARTSNFFLQLEKFAECNMPVSRLFHLLNLTLKFKQKVEYLPLALSLKCHVVVLQAMAKKCLKARATCAARLSHLTRKNIYPGIILLHVPQLNSCTSLS